MKLHVDLDLCEIHGQCAFVAPELFEITEDDELVYHEDVPQGLAARARNAVKVCPQLAIKITETSP